MEQGTFNNCLSCPEIFVLEIRRLLPRSGRTMGTRPTLKMLPLPVCLTQTKRSGEKACSSSGRPDRPLIGRRM